MIYTDRDDLDLAFFIAEKKIQVSDNRNLLGSRYSLDDDEHDVSICHENFWKNLTLFIVSHEDPSLAQKAAATLFSQWFEASRESRDWGHEMFGSAFVKERADDLYIADNFFKQMNDLIQSTQEVNQVIQNQRELTAKKSSKFAP